MQTMSEAIEEREAETGTPKRQLFSCGVGSFGNDLIDKVMFSFSLVYFTRVANLSSKQAGLIVVIGQITCFISNILFGYCCDKVDVPFVSRKHGRRKTWHLIGVIVTGSFFVLAYSRCFVCTESTSSWLKFVYFAVAYGVCCFGWGIVEIGHLSIFPETAKNQDEVIILNSLR